MKAMVLAVVGLAMMSMAMSSVPKATVDEMNCVLGEKLANAERMQAESPEGSPAEGYAKRAVTNILATIRYVETLDSSKEHTSWSGGQMLVDATPFYGSPCKDI